MQVTASKTILTAGPSITQKEIDHVLAAVSNGWNENWAGYIKAFEKAFADYIGVKYAMTTVRSIVERIRDHIDSGVSLRFGEVPYRPGQVMHLEADISRLREATGWSPRIGLDEGLRRTVGWYRRNGEHYA